MNFDINKSFADLQDTISMLNDKSSITDIAGAYNYARSVEAKAVSSAPIVISKRPYGFGILDVVNAQPLATVKRNVNQSVKDLGGNTKVTHIAKLYSQKDPSQLSIVQNDKFRENVHVYDSIMRIMKGIKDGYSANVSMYYKCPGIIPDDNNEKSEDQSLTGVYMPLTAQNLKLYINIDCSDIKNRIVKRLHYFYKYKSPKQTKLF